MKKAPDWFMKRMVSGVHFLLGLPLRGVPRHAPTDFVASIWISSLWDESEPWDERLDDARLHHAFDRLAASTDHFPRPEDLRGCLRPRPDAPLN